MALKILQHVLNGTWHTNLLSRETIIDLNVHSQIDFGFVSAHEFDVTRM